MTQKFTKTTNMKDLIVTKILVLIIIVMGIYIYSLKVVDIPSENISDEPHFVWNDVSESIPLDGTPVLLEMTENGIIYLAPIDIK
jgi:hypothetical protein